MSLLDSIHGPQDVQNLTPEQLPILAEEIRLAILNTVSQKGGHLGSNLGVVELTIALLRSFSPPQDKILFDVSHQCYAYKLLTDRHHAFENLRQSGGASGFLKRAESPYDAFGAGHAGTAISAGLGFAVERDLRGGEESVVAVVGDASLANGVSLEALNNIATTTRKFIIVLNDNRMAINKNVGALSLAFGRLLGNPRYNRIKSAIEEVGIRRLHLTWLRTFYHALERVLKSTLLPNTPFESLGIRYIGPIHGHNMRQLEAAFESAQQAKGPVLIHVSTQKGHGYTYAEQAPEAWHSVAPFEIPSGRPLRPASGIPWSTCFGETLTEMANQNPKITAITAAMSTGTGLECFEKAHPTRFHDVGICEEHQMTFAAGLAAAGMRPVVAVYSTFFQRALDGLIHDIALQKLPVVICLDRAGVVPGDGPTHHGIFDIALARAIPGVTLMQPRSRADLTQMLQTALSLEGPSIIRYPRGNCTLLEEAADTPPLTLGQAKILASVVPKSNSPTSLSTSPQPVVAIWSLGPQDAFTEAVASSLAEQGIASIRVDARFAKPIDTALLHEQARQGIQVFLTVEDGIAMGGFGCAVEAFFSATPDVHPTVISFGWPDAFVPHADSLQSLLQHYHLTAEDAVERILSTLSTR